MSACIKCGSEISDKPICPHCGTIQKIDNIATPQRIIVTDVNMPFASMVGFMVKAALAAIPAFIIIGLLYTFMAAFLIKMFGGRPF